MKKGHISVCPFLFKKVIKMAVKLNPPKKLYPIKGIKLAAVAAGIRYQDRNDLVVIEIAQGTNSAAVFTRNAFCAAPVHICREHLAKTAPRYLLINSGNANAGTGDAGMDAAYQCCASLAEQADCIQSAVLPFSTGVIGEPLAVEKFPPAIAEALANQQEDAWLAAAQAIMTTDTMAKGVSKQIEIAGKTVTLTGIAKGSGMIKPDMATLLAYVATDAKIPTTILQSLLQQATDDSFNAITVDGDTSTNDSLVLMATGQSGVTIDASNPDIMAVFQQVLNELMQQLAHTIIRDGEGATKFITIHVTDAKHRDEAREVAYTVAHSPLVKTALFASDPNWGRILAAVGRSDIEQLDVNRVSLWLGETQLLENGMPAASYTEEKGQIEMNKQDITITIQLGRGNVDTKVWTNDLSYEYIKINAEYRS
jgi:glutamate N-acetyltransferase/amino-acid N-acetyltransferase